MIIFVGDVHGKFKELMDLIKRHGIINSTFILLGDCGVGFNKHNYYNTLFNVINIELEKSNNKIYGLRGNHDNPSYFPSDYGNIKFVKDYSCIEIENHRILFLGGACSVDRNQRTVNSDYWLDEKFNFNEEKLNIPKCDIVVSHTAPSVCYPYTNVGLLERCKNDHILYSDITEERKELNIALEILMKNNNITNWYYGHFHKNHIDTINNIRFECLDELNFSILD